MGSLGGGLDVSERAILGVVGRGLGGKGVGQRRASSIYSTYSHADTR